ncbi:hypothetical protein ACA910_010022 [Epithemia clementina (nom. ined.)]
MKLLFLSFPVCLASLLKEASAWSEYGGKKEAKYDDFYGGKKEAKSDDYYGGKKEAKSDDYYGGKKEAKSDDYYGGKKEAKEDDDYFYHGGKKEGKEMDHYGGKKESKSCGKKEYTDDDHDDYQVDDDAGVCYIFFASECVGGDCPLDRRRRDLQPRLEEEYTPVAGSSLVYHVPYNGVDREKTFCLIPQPDGLCQMLSASADIYVDGYLIDSDLDISNEGDVYSFRACEGSVIQVDVFIPLDPAIRCIRAGSFTYNLASN